MMSRLDDATTLLAGAEAAFRTQGSPSGLAWCLSAAGQVARYRFDFETELLKQTEARKIFVEIGAPSQIAFTLINEGIALTLLGRAEEAVLPGRRAVALVRELSLNDEAIESLALTGWFEHEAGNHGNALDLYEEALHLAAPVSTGSRWIRSPSPSRCYSRRWDGLRTQPESTGTTKPTASDRSPRSTPATKNGIGSSTESSAGRPDGGLLKAEGKRR